ncbi:MAG: hypothetical protein HY908_05340 [Myxococcales bacterium]|nr:hypothetical protein [Myxococcales bacterium]
MPRRLLAAAFVAMLGVLGAACGPPWEIVRRAPGELLLGRRSLGVAPVSFEGASVEGVPASEWLAAHDEEAAERLAASEQRFDARFGAALRAAAAGYGIHVLLDPRAERPIVVPRVTELDPGSYDFDAARASRVALAVLVVGPSGALEEVALSHGSPAVAVAPGPDSRLNDDATALGAAVAEYLRRRVAGED